MTFKVFSATNIGFDGCPIEVECDSTNGLPNLLVVGLGSKAVDEAKERIRSAIRNSGGEFPRKRITINLAPANIPKDGAHFDLAMAVSVLGVSAQIKHDISERFAYLGELALNGDLRPVRGIIALLESLRSHGVSNVIIPYKNLEQARLIEDINIYPAKHLKEVISHLKGEGEVMKTKSATTVLSPTVRSGLSLADINGQEQAKRAMVIAAAGHHNILLSGPPGAGKTMLAKAVPNILPVLNRSEIIEVTKLYSLAGESSEQVITERPFRAPHHGASHVALTGGGRTPRPGEISLAHRGVLFLDELPEYSRQTLESLRQPLEDKRISIARANEHVSYPADFMLIATQNPCPCGYSTDPTHPCTCSAHQINQYSKKLSGPLLDRIDIVIEVSNVEHDKLLKPVDEAVRAKVNSDIANVIQAARKTQQERFNSANKNNSNMTNHDIKLKAKIQPEAKSFLDKGAKQLNLSARSYFKVIRVARTIADIDNSNHIEIKHITEALQYRPRLNT